MRHPLIALCCLFMAAGCGSSGGEEEFTEDQQQVDVLDGQSWDQSRMSDTMDLTADNQTADNQTVEEVLDLMVDSDAGEVYQPDTCDCGSWVCGSPEPGCDCGSCPQGSNCVDGACVNQPQGGALGSYCGVTPDCPGYVQDPTSGQQIFNPDFGTCANAQCDSQYCLLAGFGGYLNVPACSRACSIYIDEVNNQTGAPGPDGIEDADSPFSDCAGFVDGPAGSNWVCVNFAGPWDAEPMGYCAPGSSFAFCDSDSDCSSGEQCMFSTIGGEYKSRCVARLQETSSNHTAELTEACDELASAGLPTYCEGGWCFGLGCVSYCKSNADCDTTQIIPDTGCDAGTGTCKGWPEKSCTKNLDCSAWECGDGTLIFNDLPEYTPRLCWPKTGCETDADCLSGHYCYWNYDGATDPGTGLPAWSNICLAQTSGGAGTGEPCGPNTPCSNGNLCMEGYCSALCVADSDCGTNQLCTIEEFTLDYDQDGMTDQVLPLGLCSTHVGSMAACHSNTSCPNGEHCEVFIVKNPTENADSPHLAIGACETTDAALAAQAQECYYRSDCQDGWCLGSDPDAGTTGFCTTLCEEASDCPGITVDDGSTYTGICSRYTYTYGGDATALETNIYLGLCVYTVSEAQDCSSDFACQAGEACTVFGITYDPPYTPHLDYVCLSMQNSDYSYPTLNIGQTCNPYAEDSEGNPLTECLSGMCFEDVFGGYCGALCTPGSGDCANGGPEMACLPFTVAPRSGQYESNSVSWYACRKDIDCTPCQHSSFCPGDRSCVNLGQDDSTLADYRCVKSCGTNADCVGEAVTMCSQGADAYGNPTKGCFEMGSSFPVNHCM